MYKIKMNAEKIIIFLISIFCAFYSWSYVVNKENPMDEKTIYGVSVQILNKEYIKNQNLIISPNQKFNVDVTVKGRLSDLNLLTKDNIKAYADFKNFALKVGENKIPVETSVSNSNISLLKDKNVSFLNISIDRLVKKTVPLELNINGYPKEGYYYVSPTEKLTIECSGSYNSLAPLKKVIGTVYMNNKSSEIVRIDEFNPINEYKEKVDNIEYDKNIKISIPVLKK